MSIGTDYFQSTWVAADMTTVSKDQISEDCKDQKPVRVRQAQTSKKGGLKRSQTHLLVYTSTLLVTYR